MRASELPIENRRAGFVNVFPFQREISPANPRVLIGSKCLLKLWRESRQAMRDDLSLAILNKDIGDSAQAGVLCNCRSQAQQIFTGKITRGCIAQISSYENGTLIHLNPQDPGNELMHSDYKDEPNG